MATVTPVDGDTVEKKPDQKKQTAVLKPWFNWWLLPTGISIGPVTIVSTAHEKTNDGKPHASKDIAETAARDLIKDHNMNCDCGTDLGDWYLGAYEEGKSPE